MTEIAIFQSMTNKMQRYTVYYFCKLLYMFRVDPPPHHQELNTVSTASGICQTVIATCRYCGRAAIFSSSTIATCSNKGLTNTRCCSTVLSS